jgi:hypothetical protein
MKDVLKALDKNQTVTVMYRGKVRATIVPAGKSRTFDRVKSHPFFGMHGEDKMDVATVMQQLRGGRY